MKKLSMLIAATLGSIAMTAQAQEAPAYENWVGGFAQYYNADGAKGEPSGGLDDGRGFGGELGFRFDPSWAVRFELGRVLLDNSNGYNDDGTQVGADVMYFFEEDAAYLFSGLREQSLDSESYRMLSAGLGKHWELSDNLRLITEIATYYDFGQRYKDYSAKLGLAYVFGNVSSTPTSQPDSDGDGVYDAVDRCPSSPAGTSVDATGCNIDMDGDGVNNAQDQCPSTAAGTSVDARGCAIKDTDNDGVVDSKDECANTPSSDKVDALGCSVFEKEEVSVELDILFANNSSVISNADSARIQNFVDFMNRYPNTQAVVEGHSSSVGSAEYNQFLSEKRAKTVRQLLIDDYGIDADRLEAQGFGESQLKDTSNTAEAHRINRRIEVKVTALVETKATR
ncbi:OmpA family protein [Glaciecola sp. 2405UD65-10]|uniref:OmpA family protein n=1 Tax=Glaciecola sp. 2405UD65-10 TaxID=3397244 RepID=UPI003B5B0606